MSKPDRTRDVLAIVNFPNESSSAWAMVFEEIKQRGVKKIDLVISDALSGIEDAAASRFSRINHQLCVIRLKRNVLNRVKYIDKQEISEALKDVFRTEDSSDSPAKAWQRWFKFIEKNNKKYPFLNKMKTERYKLYFTYIKYDYRIRSMLYSTNWIERLNRYYKRTTRMRGSLPNPEVTILLLGYVAINTTGYFSINICNYEKSFNWEDN